MVKSVLLAVILLAGCDERSAKVAAPAPATKPSMEQRDVVSLTPIAAQKIRQMSRGLDTTASAYLRVGVKPGEPPAMTYQLDIVEVASPADDYLGHSQGIRIVVDRRSSIYLMGTTIDFRITPSGSGFWFDNPNAKNEHP